MSGLEPDVARLRRGALSALREGRVVVGTAAGPAGSVRPSVVVAEVLGHSGRHRVELDGGCWSCSCSAAGLCAHVVAVRLVTRHAVDLERVSG